jgi:3-hydroxyacyl-CoA dehydrogenase
LETTAVFHQQSQADVVGYSGCGGGGEGYQRHRRVIGSDVGNLQVGGTEVVTPLRHAMGFVDGNHPHFHLSEVLDETPLAQPLGRDIEELDATADGVAETVMEVLASAGKKPCLCKKDVQGFIANRLQHALWREAISIVEHGIADAETVDTAIKNSFGLRLPQLSALENSDMVGTQLTWNIHSYVLKDLEDSHEPSPLLKQMLDEGKLGFKSGEGFMKWTQEKIDKCNADLNSYLIHMLYER